MLVWVAAAASLGLAAWLLVAGAVKRQDRWTARWAHRLQEWGKAAVFLVIGVEAVIVALGGDQHSSKRTNELSAWLLSLPGGVLVLGAIGVAVAATGILLGAQGPTRRFEKTIRVPSGWLGPVVVVLGMIGFLARGIAITVVGVLIVVAAFTLDPQRAAGLDGALKTFVSLPFGGVVLVGVGVGWIASGAYECIRVRLAKL